MTPPAMTFRANLLCTVSRGVLVVSYAYSDVDETPLSPFHRVMPFLERMRLWLQLLLGGLRGRADAMPIAESEGIAINRARLRRKKHAASRGPNAALLGYNIYRWRGMAASVQWLYNYTLLGRVVRCFRDGLWRSLPRRVFAHCGVLFTSQTYCAAILSPD